jgi:hypothetical protein
VVGCRAGPRIWGGKGGELATSSVGGCPRREAIRICGECYTASRRWRGRSRRRESESDSDSDSVDGEEGGDGRMIVAVGG